MTFGQETYSHTIIIKNMDFTTTSRVIRYLTTASRFKSLKFNCREPVKMGFLYGNKGFRFSF